MKNPVSNLFMVLPLKKRNRHKYSLLLIMTLIVGCGGAPTGNPSNPNGQFNNAPVGNPQSGFTPPSNLPTDCSANPHLGVWVNNTDPTDKMIFTADCKLTSTKCSTVFSVPGSDVFVSFGNAHYQAFLYVEGSTTGPCAPVQGTELPGGFRQASINSGSPGQFVISINTSGNWFHHQ